MTTIVYNWLTATPMLAAHVAPLRRSAATAYARSSAASPTVVAYRFELVGGIDGSTVSG
jgi:hypothetical protein